MMRLAPLLILAALAGCGADGPPVPPEPAASGITITGQAEIGISGRL